MYAQILFIVIFLLSYGQTLCSQVKGCTDPKANNYNTQAEENDGSCTYDPVSITPIKVCSKLSDSVKESSGMIYFQNLFWTINDGGNPACIYAFDSSSGTIKRQLFIRNVINTDWEDITQDSEYIYIGDFGNNTGNRKDLRILKILKSSIPQTGLLDTIDIDGTIRFEMKDQINFNTGNMDHDFDMEAFTFAGDSLHLFSKNWSDARCRHYICSRDTGFYSLLPVETLETGGQITGACSDANGRIVLCGYSKNNLSCFVYVLWDFKSFRFLSGNRRRIVLGNMAGTPGQCEAVSYNSGNLYLSSEKYISNASLYRLQINEWTGKSSMLKYQLKAKDIKITFSNDKLTLLVSEKALKQTLNFYDAGGKLVYSLPLNSTDMVIDVSAWATGIYSLRTENGFIRKYQLIR